VTTGYTKSRTKRKSRGSTRSRELGDQELLASAWRALHCRPRADGSGCFRARYSGSCPRCEKRIAVGQEIHWMAKFGGYVHRGCKTKAPVLEGGQPHTVTVRRFSTAPNVCPDCNTEHAGPCW
jgi:hypothetical protein